MTVNLFGPRSLTLSFSVMRNVSEYYTCGVHTHSYVIVALLQLTRSRSQNLSLQEDPEADTSAKPSYLDSFSVRTIVHIPFVLFSAVLYCEGALSYDIMRVTSPY